MPLCILFSSLNQNTFINKKMLPNTFKLHTRVTQKVYVQWFFGILQRLNALFEYIIAEYKKNIYI